jgi:predicted component of type VI protein secretion system
MNVTMRVIQGKPAGKRLGFTPGEYYFGRGEECHVRPDSDWVSRQHCRLRVAPDGVFLRDLGSLNGTLVNGALLTQERRLAHGDQVQVGPLVFELLIEAAAQPPRTVVILAGSTAEAPAAPPAPDAGRAELTSTERRAVVPAD